jgi:branched-subunit amino acid transport protein
MISAKQLAAQRWEQDQALDLKRQQIVSAFIGEINVILNELHEFLRPGIQNALRAIESGGEEFDAEVVRIGRHLGRLFDNSPIRVRLLPKPISAELMRFYYLVEETKMDLDWYYRAIDMYFNHQVLIMKPMQLTRLLKQILTKLNSSENLGRSLLGELKKIRDTETDQPQIPWYRVRNNCAHGSWYHKLVSKAHESGSAAATLDLAMRARSWLSQLISRAAKSRLAMRLRSWLSRLIPFGRAAKSRLAMRARSWLSRLIPFGRAAELRLAMYARSWVGRLIPFGRAAKLHLTMRARSWVSKLIPVGRAAKLHLAMRARSWVSRLIPFARAAKLHLTMRARSGLSRLIPFARAAKLHLAMRARSGLSKHTNQGPHPLGPANKKEGTMAQRENAPPPAQEPPRELSELPARDAPTHQVVRARLRLVSFAFVRFLSIFIGGVVATLAWQSWGGAALKAIDGAAKEAICARSAGSQENPDMTSAPSPSAAKPMLPTRTPPVH